MAQDQMVYLTPMPPHYVEVDILTSILMWSIFTVLLYAISLEVIQYLGIKLYSKKYNRYSKLSLLASSMLGLVLTFAILLKDY